MMGDNRDNSNDSRYWGHAGHGSGQGARHVPLLVLGRREELAAVEPHLPTHPLSARPPRAGAAPTTGRGARRCERLYVHVPFCARRCHYCDFATGAISSGAVERYLSSVEREAARCAPRRRGTRRSPRCSSAAARRRCSAARHFARLMRAVRDHFAIAASAEITLEANPESVRPALLDAWMAGGVNRLSMGAQSFDTEELVRLGRIHGPERPAAAMALARRHGFRRLSLDLMFGFPGHELERWLATLATAIALEPEHAVRLLLHPGRRHAAGSGRARRTGDRSRSGPAGGSLPGPDRAHGARRLRLLRDVQLRAPRRGAGTTSCTGCAATISRSVLRPTGCGRASATPTIGISGHGRDTLERGLPCATAEVGVRSRARTRSSCSA